MSVNERVMSGLEVVWLVVRGVLVYGFLLFCLTALVSWLFVLDPGPGNEHPRSNLEMLCVYVPIYVIPLVLTVMDFRAEWRHRRSRDKPADLKS